jgi:hypothetical protein
MTRRYRQKSPRRSGCQVPLVRNGAGREVRGADHRLAVAHAKKISPARRGAVLSVLPDMPFDPEPYILDAAHCWNGGPIRGAAAIYFSRPPQAMMGDEKSNPRSGGRRACSACLTRIGARCRWSSALRRRFAHFGTRTPRGERLVNLVAPMRATLSYLRTSAAERRQHVAVGCLRETRQRSCRSCAPRTTAIRRT